MPEPASPERHQVRSSVPQGTFPPAHVASPQPDASDELGWTVPSTPSHDREAEQAVLGACMFQSAVIDGVRQILEPGDFYQPAHTTIWHALLELRKQNAPTDPIALTHQLRSTGDLTRIGGPAYLHTLVGVAAAGSGAEYYADIVRHHADLRALQATAIRVLQGATAPGADPAQVRGFLTASLSEASDRARHSSGGRLHQYAKDGWSFVNDAPTSTAPVWGTPGRAAWASGESLMLVGPPGVGKSTIAQQIVMARLGLYAQVLDMPVQEGEKVLYIAADRPSQLARAFHRIVHKEDRDILRQRLVFWGGPLPASLNNEPQLLAELAAEHSADTVVIDSLKDVVGKLTDDEAGLAYNNARQQLLRNGVELLELHHQRKQGPDVSRNQRPVLDQVYGSAWFTAGAGSVLFLSGAAGDPVVQLHHLKTIDDEIGPLPVLHDHARGMSRVDTSLDPLTLLRQAGSHGLTARQLATQITGEANPRPADLAKARRRLEALAKSGHAVQENGAGGGAGGGQATRWTAATRQLTAVS
ncbi:AAA family ATPase [Streptomyces sp. TRM66268-LWL]|uniref:AAA family ATPase n=1 Tax=Streptomyces polyasparticus TaxID=2767826 RepID=A0ABR7SG34_9ACTN|nr:DnaB-like helicase N-terminal domain-containing protein [Streptomyces polyasparticus]MBC9714451.1 AAA family ATPase [Streptomyces polyasparticus]